MSAQRHHCYQYKMLPPDKYKSAQRVSDLPDSVIEDRDDDVVTSPWKTQVLQDLFPSRKRNM
jgi:hypothetical protein